MGRNLKSRFLARATLAMLLTGFAGCTDPWIVQGGFDVHDPCRPTAFVEGNTPPASWIGARFGWQPVAPPHWQPVYASQGNKKLAERDASWVFRQPQQGSERSPSDTRRATAHLPALSAESRPVQ